MRITNSSACTESNAVLEKAVNGLFARLSNNVLMGLLRLYTCTREQSQECTCTLCNLETVYMCGTTTDA